VTEAALSTIFHTMYVLACAPIGARAISSDQFFGRQQGTCVTPGVVLPGSSDGCNLHAFTRGGGGTNRKRWTSCEQGGEAGKRYLQTLVFAFIAEVTVKPLQLKDMAENFFDSFKSRY